MDNEIEFETCEDCEINLEEDTDLTDIIKAVEMTGKQSRYKSWALWLSVAGLISVLFSAFGIWEKIGIDSHTFDTIVACVGSVLTAFGIVNNPTEKGEF